MQVGGEPPDDSAVVRHLRDHVRAAEGNTALDQVPAGLQAPLVIVRSRELCERLPEATVVVLEAVVVHPAEERFAERGTAETIAVLVDVEDVAACQLVQQAENAAVVGVSYEQSTQLERRLLSLEAQALDEPAGVFAQRREAGQQHVLECGGQLGIRTVRGKGPDPVDVADDLLRHELAQDLDAVEWASCSSTVQPVGEPLDVGCAAEERRDELEGLRRREAGEGHARALPAQTQQARCGARTAALALAHDEQERVARREPGEPDEQGEACVVGVVHVVDLDHERLGTADVCEPAVQRAGFGAGLEGGRGQRHR